MVHSFRVAGGRLILGCEISAEHAFHDEPDLVVVATGSVWNAQLTASGAADARCSSPVKVLPLDAAIETATRGSASVFGAHAMIVDASGTYAPLGLADVLSAAGIRIALVSPNERVGSVASLELELPHVMPRLLDRGVQVAQASDIEYLNGTSVFLKSIWGGPPYEVANVDSLVIARSRTPVNELFAPLQARHPQVHCIGDAVSPRTTAAVIHEAESLARTI